MTIRKFVLSGDVSHPVEIDSESIDSLGALRQTIGDVYAVVQPEGITFHNQAGLTFDDLEAIQEGDGDVVVKIDGKSVREVPGPKGLPFVGNYFQVFPDHLGNNQRLFEKYGPIFRTNNMGSIQCQTNDPDLAQICFAESEWWSKEIVPFHPLYPIKNNKAGVFLGDTSDPNWKIAHKFLPPALGPKAVRHYAPTMNGCMDEALPILDELEQRNEAWNVYHMMLKLSSGAVGKIMLGMDFKHFESIESPLNRLPLAMAEILVLNKKIQSHGEWYSQLPFGDPARLQNLRQFLRDQIQEVIDKMEADKHVNRMESGDLPLQDAALKARNVIDYLVRATSNSGEHLPTENLESAVEVATGAGFVTTSSLLSWCIYGLLVYPGMQTRLLQELIDYEIRDVDNISADQIEELRELDKYIKEMQRRHNPSYQPGRTAQRDQILPGGYKIKKGTVVIVALHHIHMNPFVWDNPDRFDPDRWDTDAVKNRHKLAYAPFGQGQRMCIGFNFALLEVKIFLCKLIYRYHWVKEGDVEMEYDPFFQLIRPINLYVKTQRREVYPSKSGELQT